MTEAEWLAARDPSPMLTFAEPRMTERQRYLFVAACGRRARHVLTDDRLQRIVELAEQYADGRADQRTLSEAVRALPRQGYRPPPPQALQNPPPHPLQPLRLHFGGGTFISRPGGGIPGIVNFNELPDWCRAAHEGVWSVDGPRVADCARRLSEAVAGFAADEADQRHPHRSRLEQVGEELWRAGRYADDYRYRGITQLSEEQADLIRRLEAERAALERAIPADAERIRERALADERAAQADLIRCAFGNLFREPVFDPGWRTSVVVGMARSMHESRDFAALPILADALEDAGCDDADLLAHCRTAGVHAYGCWVLDVVPGPS